MVDGHKDLQTKLPDFTTSSLCLWTGVELGLSQHLTTWRLLPAHRVPAAPGPLDLRFYFLGPFLLPYHCAVCCILASCLEGLPQHLLPPLLPIPGGIEPTREPEAGPGPALISHVSLVGCGESRSGEEDESKTPGIRPPFS